LDFANLGKPFPAVATVGRAAVDCVIDFKGTKIEFIKER